MQPIIAFNQERPARLLVDYMCSQGIDAAYHRLSEENAHGVVVRDVSKIEPAKLIIQEFLANPNDGKYQQAAWQSGQITQTMAEDKGAFKIDPGMVSFKQIPFTLIVMALCLFVFASSTFYLFRDVLISLRIVPLEALVASNEWWRLIGPVFIHFGIIHLVFNLLGWWVFGSRIERTMGISVLVILFLLSAVISNLAQLFISGPNFGGLSGVVYAVLGFVWWIGWLRPQWGLSVPKPFVGMMLIWLVLGYLDVLWVSMANTAHTAGLLVGCGLAWVLARQSETNPGKGT